MGKGNRNRQERAEELVLEPQKYVKKKKHMPAFVGTLLIAVIAITLVVVMVGTMLVGTGMFMRMSTAANTDDIKVDGEMMTYFIYSQYDSYISMMYQYGMSSYIQFDTTQSLKLQTYDSETGSTWFDYFANLAKSQVEQYLVYAQAAKANGVALDDEDYAEIDAAIESLYASAELYAAQYGTTVDYYMTATYGKGVKEKDIRNAMELQQLAAKYSEMVSEDFLGSLTDEQIEQFFEENKEDYISADYLSYKLTVEKDTEAEDADAQYATDKELLTAAAEKLAALTTAEDFKAGIKDYFIAASTEEYRETYYEAYLAEAEGETDEEKAAAAEQKLQDKLDEDAEKQIADILTEEYAYSSTAIETDLGKWVFGTEETEAAAVNTTTTVVDDSKDADGTYTITVYLLTREASRDRDTTRAFSYLLLEEAAGYTEQDAKDALAKFEQGEKNSEAMLALADDYEAESGSGKLEEVAEGSTGVDELDAWLFAEERQVGDCAQITYTIDETVFYLVVYLDAIDNEEWYINCRDDKVSAMMDAWYDEAVKTYAITFNAKTINKVEM